MLRPTGDNKINEEKAKILGSRMAESFRIHQDQVAAVREFAQNSPYPVILGGDFNSVPSSYEYYHLSKTLMMLSWMLALDLLQVFTITNFRFV